MKIFVGMSGGVDSSVTATLLKEQGHEVFGVFIKGWYPEDFPCTWREDRMDAMRVAAHIGIPFHTLDLSKEYKQHVVDYLIEEYKIGRTPNPDTLCNRDIKFGHFFNWARKHGAEAVATGHYAKTQKTTSGTKLLRGESDSKDQSYFLYTLTQKELPYVLFPIGELKKPDVRAIAKKKNIPVAEKPDSQGLCFLGKLDMEEFLGAYIKESPGNIINSKGEIVGKHSGIQYYTIGQRHGIGVQGGSKEPQYVLSKNINKNTITIGSKKEALSKTPDTLTINTLSWTNDRPKSSEELTAQYRYHGPRVKVSALDFNNKEAMVSFREKLEDAPAQGQALVFYKNEECLGGGMVV